MQETPKNLQTLRQRAEDIFRGQKTALQHDDVPQSVAAMQTTVHELRVHQIELEMQNEELRRTQLELDASRERYFDLYDLAPVAYCTVSEQGQILEANMAAATLLGMSRRTLVGQRISRFIVKTWQDTYYLHNHRMFTSGEPQAYELQMTKGDGVNFWVNMAATLAHDASGTPLQRIVLNDVTDAKLMVAAMQASEARFRALVEWSPDAIVVHRDGKIIFVNPATLDMFGAKTPSELVGKALLDRVHPDFRAMVMERVKKVSKHTNIAPPMMEEVLLKLDGTPINVEVQSISTVYDDAPAIQVTMRNITARKQAEQLLRQNRDTFFNLIQNAPFGLYVVDAQFRMCQASRASHKAFANIDPLIGRDFEEILRLAWAEPFLSEVLGRFRHTLQTGQAYAAPNTTEQRRDTPDIESYDWKIERITLPDGQLGVVCYFYDITERMQAQAALRESEEFSRSIIKSSQDCIKVLDLEGNLLSMQSGQELLGIEDIEPFLNNSWLDFWASEADRRAAQAAVASAAAGGAGSFVGFFRTLRGVPKWWEVAISPILDANGKPARLLAASRDVTDRQQAEDVLRQRTAQFETLVNEAPHGVYLIDADFRIRQVNPTGLSAFGNMPELIGRDFAEVMHILWPKTKADEVIQQFRHTLATGEAYFVPEMIETRADRQTTEYYEWQINRIPLPDGRHGVVCYFRDISEHVLAQQKIRESEERYRNLFNSIDTGFCVIDMIFDAQQKPVDYRFLEINPSFEKQSGMANAVGKRLLEFTSDLEPYWFEIYGKVAVTGEAIRIVRQAKPLSDRTFDLYAFKVGGPDSRKVAILFTDITERRQEEVHKELLSRELRGKHTDLVLALASAEKANHVKTDFLSSMSHELRTPLSAILGFAQLIESGKPAPTASQKRSIDQILQAGWYLLELINEILDLAKIESGKLSLSMQPTALAGVLRECEALIGPMAQKGGLSVSFAAPQAAYAVQADPTRMKQVLFNLLSNAIKYNKAGGTVNVTCMAVTPARVRISVEDTGKGLTPRQIAQLFQPFNRLGQEATSVEGTGIGLVMTKRLVEMMGGEIGVHSTVGTGSVFWVEMNLVSVLPSSAEVEVKVDAEAEAEAEANFMAKSLCTLLYVEDNPASLMLMQDLMARRPDIHLLTATDALSGVTLARAERPDVILMDINLPGISGLEALNILLGDPRTARTPVVALSANAIPADIERGLAAGFFSYLTKPLKVNEFMQTLDAASQFAKATPGAPMALPREQA